MFQTEPILFLQSFGSAWLTAVMTAVSAMGVEPFYAAAIAVILAGISIRRGFLLLQLLLWSALVNSALKDAFALPRPAFVDLNVLDEGRPGSSPFRSMGATTFLGGLRDEVVAHTRALVARGQDAFGFPSGHVQGTTAMWGGLAVLFDSRALRRIAPPVVVLMALSRMYLGRHFLADVLGGAAIGAVLLAVFALALRRGWAATLVEPRRAASGARLPDLAAWLLLVGAPLCVLPWYPARAGMMLGVGAGFLLVRRGGLPDDAGTLAQRAGRVAIALVLYGATAAVFQVGVGASGVDPGVWWVQALGRGLPAFAMLWGTVESATRAGLYRRPA